MDIQSLIRLANQADFEGNYRVADKLTERAIRQAASIFKDRFSGFRSVGPTMMALLSGGNIVGTKNQTDPTHIFKKGRWVSPADAARIDAAHAADIATARANKAGKPKGGAAAPGAAAPGVVQTAPGGAPVAQAAATATANPTIIVKPAKPAKPAKNGIDGRDGRDGRDGGIGATGATGQTGLQGEAGAWWPGVVAALASGALTTAGVAAYLKSQGASDDAVRSITQKVSNPDFKANQLAARTEANQMGNQQAAQDFIEARKGTPGFNTAQDFYYAAQAAGMNQSMMNQIAALAKAEGMRDLTRFRD